MTRSQNAPEVNGIPTASKPATRRYTVANHPHFSRMIAHAQAVEDAALYRQFKKDPRFIEHIARYGTKPAPVVLNWGKIFPNVKDGNVLTPTVTQAGAAYPMHSMVHNRAGAVLATIPMHTLVTELDGFDGPVFVDAEPLGRDSELFDTDYSDDGEGGDGVCRKVAGMSGLDRMIFEDGHNGSGGVQRQSINHPAGIACPVANLADLLDIKNRTAEKIHRALVIIDPDDNIRGKLTGELLRVRRSPEKFAAKAREFFALAEELDTADEHAAAPERVRQVERRALMTTDPRSCIHEQGEIQLRNFAETSKQGAYACFSADTPRIAYIAGRYVAANPAELKAHLLSQQDHAACEVALDAEFIDPELLPDPVDCWIDACGNERKDRYSKDCRFLQYVNINNDIGRPLTMAEYMAALTDYREIMAAIHDAKLKDLGKLRKAVMDKARLSGNSREQVNHFWSVSNARKRQLEAIRAAWVERYKRQLLAVEAKSLANVQACVSYKQACTFWGWIKEGAVYLGRPAFVEHILKPEIARAFDRFPKPAVVAPVGGDIGPQETPPIEAYM